VGLVIYVWGMTYTDRIREAQSYYRLVSEAQALGVPTSLDDPRSPKTVAGLRAAVEATR
jgi:hypothetical protein